MLSPTCFKHRLHQRTVDLLSPTPAALTVGRNAAAPAALPPGVLPRSPGGKHLLLSDEETREFREAFDLFDLDGGGSIDQKGARPVMRSLGANPTNEEIEMMIQEVDEDGGGEIEFKFCQLMARASSRSATARSSSRRPSAALTRLTPASSARRTCARSWRIWRRSQGSTEVDEIVELAAEATGEGKVSWKIFLALMHPNNDA